MLNIDEIQNGIVIDHIKAGTAVGLMELLGITGNKTANVALIQNARSHKADCGRKDIIKVEGDASWLNLDVLAYPKRVRRSALPATPASRSSMPVTAATSTPPRP